MAPTTRLAVTINLGPSAPIEVVSGTLNALSCVCRFGGDLQDAVSRTRAQREILREPRRWLPSYDRYLEDTYPFNRGQLAGPSPYLDEAIGLYMREFDVDTDGDVVVEHVSYNNPLDVVVYVGVVVYAVLEVLQTWPARFRIANAIANDFVDQVATRRQLRQILVQQIGSDLVTLSPQQIDNLLTKDVLDSFNALRSRFEIEDITPEPPDPE